MVERVACRTPAEGRDGVTNIPKWKFDAIRSAILGALGDGEIAWAELTDAVRGRLSEAQLADMGKLGWHVVSVKLEMEVRGEITRKPGKGRQVIRLA